MCATTQFHEMLQGAVGVHCRACGHDAFARVCRSLGSCRGGRMYLLTAWPLLSYQTQTAQIDNGGAASLASNA